MLKRLAIHSIRAFEKEVKEGKREPLTADELAEPVPGEDAESEDVKMEEDVDATAENEAAKGQKPFEVGPETTEEEFLSIVKADSDESVKTLTDEDLKEIYHSVRCPSSKSTLCSDRTFRTVARRSCQEAG